MKFTKEIVHNEATNLVKERIADLQQQFHELSNGADIKSTSGDKHETSRAMMHLQQEQISAQLTELNAQLNKLISLRDIGNSKTIIDGSLIKTDKSIFYLSIPLGRLSIEGSLVYLLSVGSPLGKALLGKTESDEVLMNGVMYHIVSVV